VAAVAVEQLGVWAAAVVQVVIVIHLIVNNLVEELVQKVLPQLQVEIHIL
jgi:hypothetical protein